MTRGPSRPIPVQTPPIEAPELSDDKELGLAEYLQIIRRHWRFLLVAAIIGTAAGMLQFLNTAETYQARTRIQIQKRSSSPFSAQIDSWGGGWWNPEFYPTQHEILKSRGLALELVKRERLWEDPHFSSSLPVLEGHEGTVSGVEDEAALGLLAERIRGSLEVREVTGTQLADILYNATSPRIAMRLANAYAETYIEYGKSERRNAATSAFDFMSNEIGTLQDEIREKELRIQEYSRDQDIVAVDPKANVTLQRLEAVNRDYNEARSNRISAEARYNQTLLTPKESVADNLSRGLVSTLRSDLIERQRSYTAKLQTYRPDSPSMAELKTAMEQDEKELAALIDEQAKLARDQSFADYQTARRTEEELQRELEGTKAEMMRFNSATIEYNNLQLEVEARRDLLEQLQRTQSEADVALKGAEEATVRQIDRALLPSHPISPNLQKDVVSGTGIGLFLGLGLIFLFEFLDRSVKTAEELERRLALPTLSVIPDITTKGRGYGYGRHGYGYGYGQRGQRAKTTTETPEVDLIPHHHPRLAVSEAYRSLRTALLLSTAHELKVVVVTSATAGEGKTATSANLAAVMAQLGRRVLLVDADLRKPRVHKIFGISNRKGMVNSLVGRGHLDESIAQSEVPNLFICPAGPSPPNPSELLSSQNMRNFIEAARASFDIVIFDSPPTLAVTDSTLLGHMSDGVVLCVRAGRTSKDAVRACRDRLVLSGVKILGTVLNGYRPLGDARSSTRAYAYQYEAHEDQEASQDAVA